MDTQRLISVLAIAATAAPALAQPEADAPAEKLAFGELPKNAGWLSDPGTPAETIWDSIAGGKLHLNDRLRFEYADQEGVKPSYAFTNRIRLGYETKAWHGLNGMIEMENVASFDSSLYWVPATLDGDPTRTVVADPQDTEVNQAYLQYHRDNLFDSDASFTIKAGRQRIILDDARFVGNVGWRQFEQTYDAVLAQVGYDPVTFSYAHVWKVQGIFSNGVDLDADVHIFHLAFKAADWITITPFVYLVDVQQAAALDSDTYGVRLYGSAPFGEEDAFSFNYNGYYAHQTEGRNSAIPNYDADFFALDLNAAKKGLGALGVGYQFLGSDNGADSFIFPLGTNHAFQGWADKFLTTPVAGLQDFYVYAKADLPWNVKGGVYFHEFWFDDTPTGVDSNIGWEIDAVLSKDISRNWNVLAKFAYYDGGIALTFPGGYGADTVKFWLETTFKF
ncbi:MAG: alginate export family protein [Phycisphaeraceae bacterium]|nr:MAG: alginate export family protein [Phycisphaeraceae bacterium]